jgi:hypothetical protein
MVTWGSAAAPPPTDHSKKLAATVVTHLELQHAEERSCHFGQDPRLVCTNPRARMPTTHSPTISPTSFDATTLKREV